MSVIPTRTSRKNTPTIEEHDLWARHLMVRFLQGLFNKLPEDSDYHWEPNLDGSKIFIAGGTPIDAGVVLSRPAIAVDVGPYQPANLALDQHRTSSLLTGERLHMDLVSGNLLLYVISREGDEARRIAGWASRHIRYHRRLLQKVGGFHQIAQQYSVSAPTSPGQIIQGSSDTEAIMVNVTFPWHMQWGWYTKPVAAAEKSTLDYFLGQDRAQDYERPEMQRLRNINADIALGDDDFQVSGMNPGPESQ